MDMTRHCTQYMHDSVGVVVIVRRTLRVHDELHSVLGGRVTSSARIAIYSDMTVMIDIHVPV